MSLSPASPSIPLPEQTTWAERNPSKVVLPARPRSKPSEAQKASRKLAAASSKIKGAELADDITIFLTERSTKINNLALKHNVKVSHIQKLVDNPTYYKKERAPTLPNALAHLKKLEINDDLPPGDKLKLIELQKLVREDDSARTLTKVEKDTVIATLVEYRNQKKHGARASNRAASQDVRCTVERIHVELENLAERTGTYSFFFVTRGHIDDTCSPQWYGSGDSIEFLRESLNHDPWDVTRLFEHWACSRNNNAADRDTLSLVRKQCTEIVSAGLRWASKCKKAEMNYANYETAVVEQYKVKMIGWTYKSFVNPSEIGAMVDIRKLRDALKCGECKWVRLSKRELEDHVAEVDKRRAAGEVIGRPRAERSDKGKKRKIAASPCSDSDGEAAPPKKKVKKAAPSKARKPPAQSKKTAHKAGLGSKHSTIKSVEFIIDESEKENTTDASED